ncbi:MAG: glycosyltransferase family 9 protein [Gemmataceae bacterium]
MTRGVLPENPKILIIKPSALGDICHALPVLGFLRRRFPGGHLAWLVNRSFAPLLSGQNGLDEVILFDRGAAAKGWRAGLQAWRAMSASVRAKRWDLVLDLQGLARSGLMTWITWARERWGLSDSREGSRLAYTRRILVPGGETHAVERYWLFARALGAPEKPEMSRLVLPEEAVVKAEALMEGLPRPWFVVAPGARWVTKRWPPEAFAQVVNALVRRHGGSAFLVGAPDEVELGDRLWAGLEVPNRNLTGKTSLLEMAGILSRGDLVLANDSGPLHVAVALERPVVAPFFCTKPSLTGPYGHSEGTLWTPRFCRGSLVRQCPTSMECFAELSWDTVLETANRVLGKAGAR